MTAATETPTGDIRIRRPRAQRPQAWLFAFAAALAGCAGVHYDRIRLGMPAAECERLLPAEGARRTELGLSYQSEGAGRIDAIVVLMSADRRVAGKFHVQREQRNFGLVVETHFRLAGELDPRLAALAETGPLDTLRAIVADLSAYRGQRRAMDAHAWVTAGLIRLMQRWPNVEDLGAGRADLEDVLARVPAGGDAQLSADQRGTFRMAYAQVAKR